MPGSGVGGAGVTGVMPRMSFRSLTMMPLHLVTTNSKWPTLVVKERRAASLVVEAVGNLTKTAPMVAPHSALTFERQSAKEWVDQSPLAWLASENYGSPSSPLIPM